MRPLRHPRCTRRGFSLVEVAIASVVVAVMFCAAMATVGAAARSRRQQVEWRRAEALARSLITEIAACAYQDPGSSSRFGVETDEVASDRATWNDLDDFHALDESPPKDRGGAPIPGAAGWRRSVTIEQVPPGQGGGSGLIPALLSILTPAEDSGLRRITVEVISPRGVRTRMIALRSKWGVPDVAPVPDVSPVRSAVVRVQVGRHAQPAEAATQVLNMPVP